MAKIVVVHTNTEVHEFELGKNDKVEWIVLIKNDGRRELFMPSGSG